MPKTNHCLFVAFHLNGSSNASADAARLGVLLNKIFGEEQIETVDLDVQDKEIVYKVNKPVLATEEMNQKFFQDLKKLFEETDDFHPHFTQIHI